MSSYCMPSQPQRWNEWSDRLEREERGNARWREKWTAFRPEDPADLPWSTALRRNRDLTSPRGLGASTNWSLPDATLLRSTITGLPVQPPVTPQLASTLPSLMQSTIRENELLSKQLTIRHTRRSNFAKKSMNSLSYDLLWDSQLVRCLQPARERAICTLGCSRTRARAHLHSHSPPIFAMVFSLVHHVGVLEFCRLVLLLQGLHKEPTAFVGRREDFNRSIV